MKSRKEQMLLRRKTLFSKHSVNGGFHLPILLRECVCKSINKNPFSVLAHKGKINPVMKRLRWKVKMNEKDFLLGYDQGSNFRSVTGKDHDCYPTLLCN